MPKPPALPMSGEPPAGCPDPTARSGTVVRSQPLPRRQQPTDQTSLSTSGCRHGTFPDQTRWQRPALATATGPAPAPLTCMHRPPRVRQAGPPSEAPSRLKTGWTPPTASKPPHTAGYVPRGERRPCRTTTGMGPADSTDHDAHRSLARPGAAASSRPALQPSRTAVPPRRDTPSGSGDPRRGTSTVGAFRSRSGHIPTGQRVRRMKVRHTRHVTFEGPACEEPSSM